MVWKLPPARMEPDRRTGGIAIGRCRSLEDHRRRSSRLHRPLPRQIPRELLPQQLGDRSAGARRWPAWPRLANSVLLRFGPTLVELGVVITALVALVRHRRSTLALLLFACLAQVIFFSIWFEFSERHRLFIAPVWLLLAAMTIAKQPKRATGACRGSRRWQWPTTRSQSSSAAFGRTASTARSSDDMRSPRVDNLDCQMVEIGDLPLYNQDLRHQEPPEPYVRFREQVAATDGILFCMPEYNRGVPGASRMQSMSAHDPRAKRLGPEARRDFPARPERSAGFANHQLRQSASSSICP